MIANKNFPYYLTSLGIFILLKLAYTIADTKDLIFLLYPTNQLVELLTGSQSVYIEGNGYFHTQLNILIEKSCSGFSFWLLCFTMLVFLSLKYFQNAKVKIAAMAVALTGAYILTIVVNSFRIFVSIIIQHQADNFLPARPHLILHEIVGITTNLTFLIIIYLIVERILSYKNTDEKFAQS